MPHPIYETNIYRNSRQLQNTAQRAALVLRSFQERFPDCEVGALVATGNSGVPLASVLSFMLGLELVVVRPENWKETPHLHDGSPLCGPELHEWSSVNWLFVDDLIGTGRTLIRVAKEVERMYGHLPQLVGALTYDHDVFCTPRYRGELQLPQARIPSAPYNFPLLPVSGYYTSNPLKVTDMSPYWERAVTVWDA